MNKFLSAQKTLIIAHRGYAEGCSENTIASFDKAIQCGADAIEFDIRITKDKSIVVHHDEKIRDKLIRDLTYQETISLSSSEGYMIPEFEEALKFIGEGIPIAIEIKECGYEEEILNIAQQNQDIDNFMIISFYDKSLRKIKEINPKVITGLLLGKEKPENLIKTRMSEIFPRKRLRQCKADFCLPHLKIARIWRVFGAVKKMEKVIVWTVNNNKEIKKLLRQRVKGIATDQLPSSIEIRDSFIKSE